MSAKLIIDLAKADLQEELHIQCSYKHHPANKGFDALLEMIRFALICRRCESAPCVRACPRKAACVRMSSRSWRLGKAWTI